jgi:hypothetical protein
MTIKMQGGWKAWCISAAGALLVAGASSTLQAAVEISVRDLADPVPPGGVITYRVTVRQTNASTTTTTLPPTPLCFNPPPDCVTGPATCSNPEPSCEGNPIQGFTCRHALNEGANCGVGSPLTPDASTCVPHASGTCNGGNNVGLPCTAPNNTVTEQCPGSSLVCVRAANQGDYCGQGFPPTPNPVFCLQNNLGVCDSGPNVGLPCIGPHNTPSPDCPNLTLPPPPPPPPLTPITVTLPIPAGTTFADADNGGTSDGTTITWSMAPQSSCGVPGTPQCPSVIGRVTIDPLTPLGTVITNQATAADGDGAKTSGTIKTTVGTFKLQRMTLRYSRSLGHDRLRYGTLFTLPTGASLDPFNEVFTLRHSNSEGTIFEMTVPAGQLYPATSTVWKFRTADPFVRGVLRLRGPLHYALTLRGSYLSLPLITDTQTTVTITLGDDILTQDVVLVPRRGGASYTALK